jgi:flagellar biosynthesis/type III secretory pathway chaperone
MSPLLETELATLLNDLLAGQDELLAILAKKRQLLGTADIEGLRAISAQEGELIGTLQQCLERREQLLARAAEEGLPSLTIAALADALPAPRRRPLTQQVELAGVRAKLLQQQSLVNWVIIQRTLIHLSQLLEIIATGGRLQPTYGEGKVSQSSGALVDRAA